jgi:hypothetical protein
MFVKMTPLMINAILMLENEQTITKQSQLKFDI